MAKDHPIPGTGKRKWIQRESVQEFFLSVPPIIAAWWTLKLAAATQDLGNLIVVPTVGAGWLTLASALKIYRAHAKDKTAEPSQVHDGLRAATVTLHSAVAQICGLSPQEAEKQLRVTFHRVVPPLNSPTKIEQIIAYTGEHDRRGDGCGREFLINTGVTGKAIRSRDPHVISFPDGDDAAHLSALVLELGYTHDQASGLRGGRRSAMAVPVMNRTGRHPLGVIYLDSDRRNLFDDGAVSEAILAVCNGIKSYVSERY